MSAVIIDEEIVHYEVLGRGRPLLFLHTWVGSWRYWVPAMQAVCNGYRAYALDLWGFGDTGKVSQHYNLDSQVHLLDSFLNQMGILRIALVGHGLGALVAQRFAKACPERVDRLMVSGFPLAAMMVSSRLRLEQPASLVDWLVRRTALTEEMWQDIPKMDPEALACSLDDLSSEQDLMTLPQEMACLFVYGQGDPAVQLPAEESLAALPEQTHAVIFEQSGHFPMLDESSKFNRLLLEYLELKSGDSPRQLQLKEEWKRRVR